MTESETRPGRILGFFSNPLIGILGSVASLFGVALAFYFFIESTHKRELTYFVHPVKSIVVRAGETSELSVTFNDARIEGNVTATLIAFWNAGKEPIRPQHVLRPFVIQTQDNTPILEARIRKESREVVGIGLDHSKMDDGQIGISWSILEEGDGGVVQLILSGGVDVGVSASAVIEGQPELRSISFKGKIRPPIEQYVRSSKLDFQMAITLIGIGAVMLSAVIFSIMRAKIFPRAFTRYHWFLIGQPIVIIVVSAFFVIFTPHSQPPFGF